MNYLVEHYKRFNKLPHEFRGNKLPRGQTLIKRSFKLPPKKALAVIKAKGKKIITTHAWNQLEAEAHAKAFTVAKIMNADVLQEVFDYVHKAKKDGWSLRTFQKQVTEGGLVERMQEAGWTGRSNARLKVIYDTNMKVSAAKGKYEGMQLISDIKPYWIYRQVERHTKRIDHSHFNGKKFKHDDPIWNYIYPPSAFGCACTVIATADPSGVEDGRQYLHLVQNNNNYQIKPLRQFEVDTSKYQDKIRTQLEKILGL